MHYGAAKYMILGSPAGKVLRVDLKKTSAVGLVNHSISNGSLAVQLQADRAWIMASGAESNITT